jgi:hypothetical protein
MHDITTEAQLRDLLGEPSPAALAKERTALHELDRQWLAASRFCLVATSGADGRCDVSPKGDPAGFTTVLDDRTIALPERAGNRRADGFRNVLANPHVGLVYLLPGSRPLLALVVEVEEVFHHCAKAFLRSQLWDPDTWEPDAVESRARIAHRLERRGERLEDIEAYYGEQYSAGLYPAG